MKIYGQEQILAWLSTIETLPQFIIITGGRGSGKKVLADYIAKRFEMRNTYIDNKVDDVRELIAGSSSMSTDTMFTLLKGESMSANAKNSLLKIAEEPSRHVHLALLVTDMSDTLATLQSRGHHLRMKPYSTQNKLDYLREVHGIYEPQTALEYAELCDTLGELNEFIKADIEVVLEEAKNFVDNILMTTTGNALKVVDKLKVKKDGDGIPPEIFIRAVNKIAVSYMIQEQVNMEYEELEQYTMLIETCQRALNMFRSKSASKQIILDNWIIDLTEGKKWK